MSIRLGTVVPRMVCVCCRSAFQHMELSVCRASVPVPGNVLVGSLGLCHFPAGHSTVEFALGHCPWAKIHLGTQRLTLSHGFLASSKISGHLWVGGFAHCKLLDLAGINENPTSAFISGICPFYKIRPSAFDELRSFTDVSGNSVLFLLERGF